MDVSGNNSLSSDTQIITLDTPFIINTKDAAAAAAYNTLNYNYNFSPATVQYVTR